MLKTIFESILIDYCPDCKSCWFDKDEFDNAVKGIEFNAAALIAESKAEIFQKLKRAKVEMVGNDVCPKCMNGTMAKFELFGVELDKCEFCEGLFFDRDELQKCYDKSKEGFIAHMWSHIKELL
jgi:Zn-finger nucleic acid-binding protein